MPTVTASEFARNFGRYQDEAHREPVVVTSHGRVVGGYLAAEEFAQFERLKQRERRSLIVADLPDDIVADIEAAEYGVPPA